MLRTPNLTISPSAGIMAGAYVASKSGGHLNPCVTLSLCVYRNFPWRKFPIYLLAQTFGAFCAAGVIYGNYVVPINAMEGGAGIRTVPGAVLDLSVNATPAGTATAGIFATYPAAFMTTTGAFFSELLGSAVLMIMVLVLTNPTTGAGPLTPLALAFVFIGITAGLGWETAFAINFARDFGPRLMTYMLGYGSEVWTSNGYYFWVCRESLHYPGPSHLNINLPLKSTNPLLSCFFLSERPSSENSRY